MGTSDTLPRAGSEQEADEALLRGPDSPTEPEAPAIEEGESAPESPPAMVPEAEAEAEPEGEAALDGEEAEPDLAAKPEGEADKAAAEEEPFAEREIPDDIKTLFKAEGVGPKIRDMYFRDQAYREVFSTVSEAREVKELLPNGVESAKELLDVAQRIEPFEEAFEASGKDAKGAVEFWQQIYETNQQAYHNLHSQAVDNVIHQFKSQADKSNDENLINAVDVLWRRLYGVPYEGRTSEPAQSERESNLAEREQALDTRELDGFKQNAFAQTENQVTAAITNHVNSVLKNSGVPKGAQKRIVDDIHEEIRSKISQNPTLQIQLNRAFRNGDHGPDHLSSIVSIVVKRAKNLIPETSRPIFKEWTGVYLAQHKLQTQRQEVSRVDVGTGGPVGPGNTGLPQSAQVDYGKMTDEELLTASEIQLKPR